MIDTSHLPQVGGLAHESGDDLNGRYIAREHLPSALLGGKSDLSPEALAEIASLERRDPWKFVWTLGTTWASILGAIALALYVDNLVLSIAAVIFVATRQNILGLLMHEQCHRLAFYSKTGDALCNVFCCYPLFITLEGYRRVHLAHHQCFFTDRDPDYTRKQGAAWTFPQRAAKLAGRFLMDLTGLNVVPTILGKGQARAEAGAGKSPWLPRLLFYLVALSVIAWSGSWLAVVIYWVLPLATVLQAIVRWGAICEHRYDLGPVDVTESTPLIEPRWWENLLLPNLNFTLHVYHHWFPRVPFSCLPLVHRIFQREHLVDNTRVFHGYGEFLRSLLLPASRTAP
jgi:fatty acid desaturase